MTVSATSYLLASPGQRYIVAYGALVAGFVALGRGIKRWGESRQAFPWIAFLAAMALPPIGAAAFVGARSFRQRSQQESRRDREAERLDAARAEQEEARAVKERAAHDEAGRQRHAERVARAREQLDTSTHPMTLCSAALDLGHAQAREAIPDLIALLSRRSELVSTRNCAAGALLELGEGDRALAFYSESAGDGTIEGRRLAIVGFRAIGPRAAEIAMPYLREAGQSPHWDLRYLAVEALANLGPAAEPLLRDAVQDADPRVRERATQALSSMGR
jgi:hypothetical protein